MDWRKSRYSASNGSVEIAFDGEQFHVRDSKDPDGPILTFTIEEWFAFTCGMIAGEFVPAQSQPTWWSHM